LDSDDSDVVMNDEGEKVDVSHVLEHTGEWTKHATID